MENDIEQPFWDVVTNRVEKQDQKVNDLEQKINAIPDNSQYLIEVKSKMAELISMVTKISFPDKEVRQLALNLRTCIGLLSQPVVNKVEHHHHFPKIIYATAGLFIIICLVCTALFNTHGRLEQFKENDTKYRFLKLQNNEPLRRLLFVTDSLFRNQSDMRENVSHQEDSIFDRFKRLQEIEAKEKEVKDLKGKLK